MLDCPHMPEIIYKVETERETDGRWIAEVVEVAGVLAYGTTKKEATAVARALANIVLANKT